MMYAPAKTGSRRFLGGGLAVLLVVLVALAWTAPAGAHKGDKAEPRIAAALGGEGLARTLTVRLADLDSGDPVKGATVVAVASTSDGAMRTDRVRLREVRPAVYRARIEFHDAGAWRVRITVTGEKVVTARATLPAAIEVAAEPGGTTTEEEPAASGSHEETEEAALAVLPTTFDEELTGGDYTRMAFLWVHSLAAMGWIVGVLLMVVALSTRPGVLAETARNRLAGAYRSWGALVHWGLVPVIVGTGIYNMLEVTPFELAWTPGGWDRLSEIPYGLLYESILLVKLGFFALLLVTGTMTFLRTVQLELPVVPVSNPHPRFVAVISQVLGPAGLVYLATVPLILAAAMSLRYVHVLNHVAIVSGGGHG
ncbi:MAG: hypothetical protein ACRDON_06280 [Gaiellaceae bacterium]